MRWSATGIDSRLGQVVTNLLSNAIKFGCGRPIEVELDANATVARLEVKDSGEGIPVQEQERIFERFERATSVRRHPGLGLGLWILQADRRRLSRHDLRRQRAWPRRDLQRRAPTGVVSGPVKLAGRLR